MFLVMACSQRSPSSINLIFSGETEMEVAEFSLGIEEKANGKSPPNA